MSLDDVRNPHHAAALERGDVPQIPETRAAQRAGALLRQFVASPYLTDEFWSEVGRKAMANRAVLRALFDELDADPKRLPERGAVRRQQPTAAQDQYDWHLERAAEAKTAWLDHNAAAEEIRRERLAEHDPDAREQDRENDRLREVAQDEAAREAAPRGVAS